MYTDLTRFFRRDCSNGILGGPKKAYIINPLECPRNCVEEKRKV